MILSKIKIAWRRWLFDTSKKYEFLDTYVNDRLYFGWYFGTRMSYDTWYVMTSNAVNDEKRGRIRHKTVRKRFCVSWEEARLIILARVIEKHDR